MKEFTTIFLALALSFMAFAQNEIEVNHVFEKAEFIFEGKQIEYRTFYNDSTKKSYTVYKIEISNIFRGINTLKIGTIEIIKEGSNCGITDDGEIFFIPNNHSYTPTTNGIYFCTFSTYPQFGKNICLFNEYKYSNPTNKQMLRITNDIDYSTNSGVGRKFKNKQEIYEYLKKQDNIVVPSDDNAPIKKKDASGSLNDIKKQHEIRYAQNVKNYEKYMQQLQERIAVQQANKSNACKEFFISEYADGPQKNKVIEIYNPSDSIKSLNGYSIKIFNNGAPTPLDIPLSGNVNPKETYVVTHPQADPQILAKAHQTDVKMNFDGNDAIVLKKGTSTYIDKIGEIGVNPGQAGWNVPPGASTKAQDLRRKHPIDKGETDWNQGKNQWVAFPQDSLGNVKQHQNVCATLLTNDISFSFANPTETGTNPKYFEFDIEVSTNANSTYFDNTVLSIQYNTAAFGSFITMNGAVTVTKGINFNSITYIDPNSVMVDDASDVIRIPFGTDQAEEGNLNRTLLSATPQQLFHVKIEIQNCNTNTDLLFVNTFFAENFSTYTLNPADSINNASFYDGALFPVNQLNNLLCPPPTISSFTSPVYPGTWYQGTPTSEYLLTIQGSGFGATRGNGNVYFQSADDGGQTYVALNDYDFISWGDNNIQIKMPSVINLLPEPQFDGVTPGSGIFYVKTNSGDSVLSTTPIDMPYAIKNSYFLSGEKKIRMDLANVDANDSIAITFMLDTSITNNPMIEAIVRRAVADWKCETLVYFETGGSTTLTSAPDGISVIHFTNSLPAGVLAQTSIYPTSIIQCLDNNGNKHIFPKEIDIAFLRNPTEPWYFDTIGALPAGMRDFYEVALHEVGHGNLLQHVNAPTVAGNNDELMFWTGLVGPVSFASRRTIDVEAAYGGFDVVQVSNGLNINFGTCNATNIGTLLLSPDQSCGGLIGFEEYFAASVDFNLYPNPTNNGFMVTYELKRNASVQFTFLDYMGRELKQFDLKRESTGQHKLFVETSNLATGLYFLVATIDDKTQTLKVIKQ